MMAAMRIVIRSLCLAILSLCVAAAVPAASGPISLDSGAISGVPGRNASVRVYKGIPYAAPPEGDLRWRPPKPAPHWEGVRKADHFSPACPQQPYSATSIYYRPPEPTSEDCLALNVWTAAASGKERRPVMVWIHGGALTRGSGSLPIYDGEALAQKGAVVVTLNYRLGVLGFLAHPQLTAESDAQSSGNYGILDQIAALQWVQRNIAAFGGDPKRVTIFGESAGSWSVNCLMASPLARFLFQRAIGESGGMFQPMRTLRQAEAAGAQFASSIGAQSLQELRARSADELVKQGALPLPPNVDGWMLPQDIDAIFRAGKQSDVPLIAGSNADEGRTLTTWPASRKAADFEASSRQRLGDAADRFFTLYPSATDEQARDAHYASFRDLNFGWQMRTWARLQTKTGHSKVYLYYFRHVPAGMDSIEYGAYHAAEIAYVFDNLAARKQPATAEEQRLADLMSAYWFHFAATGDPNGEGLPRWPVYDSAADVALEFDGAVKAVKNRNAAALDFWDSVQAKK